MPSYLSFRHVGPAVVAALIAAGSGGCNADIVPVSGKVTLDGEPLAGAVINFQPIRDSSAEPPAATGSVGHTDAQGQYVLRLVEPDRTGALVGEHTVTISTATMSDVEGEPPQGERAPEAWRDGSQRFTVPASGTNQANFALATPPPAEKTSAKRKRK
jgi:hypothetical protein